MPRLPYVERNDLPDDKQHVYDAIERSRGVVANVFRALLNSPDAASKVGELGGYLRYQTAFDPAIREMVILTISRELGVDYEWTHHVSVAREAGVREEVIDAIRSGKAPMGLPAKEGVFAQAAKELLRDTTLSDATFQAVEHLIGPEQTVDLIVLVGYYAMLARVIKALGVELEEGTVSDLSS